MRERIELLGVPVDVLTMNETLNIIFEAIETQKRIYNADINLRIMAYAHRDEALARVIRSADIISADGQSVVWLAKILGKALPERVAGIDLMYRTIKFAHEKGYRVYFLGAKEESVNNTVNYFSKKFSPDIVAGYRNGYFSSKEEPEIVEEIKAAKPDILFVALNTPQKDFFISKYREEMGISFVKGVGGSFDVFGGAVKRAPLWIQKYGMEWFYRFIKEPGKRYKRYLFVSRYFIPLLIREIINSRKH